jgi:hypothetical protein
MSSSLVYIENIISKNVFPVILTLGIVGNILLILVFSQHKQRLTPCAYYLLSGAVFSIVGSNWAVVPLIWAAYYSDPFAKSLPLCRIRVYIIHVCAMSFRTVIVLAAADRYTTSSDRLWIRALFSIKRAKRACIIVPTFWSIISVHLLIWVSIENNRCFVYGLYGFIYSIYQLICFGLLPTIFMTIFGALTLKNIHLVRRRINTNEMNLSNNILRKQDRNIALLVFLEIIISTICRLPYSIDTIYSEVTNNIPNKSIERQLIESFLIFITRSFLLHLKYSTIFYVYFITSSSFRRTLKKILLKYLNKCRKIVVQEE